MHYFDVSKLQSVKTQNSFRLLKFVKIRKFLKIKIRKTRILELWSKKLLCFDLN